MEHLWWGPREERPPTILTEPYEETLHLFVSNCIFDLVNLGYPWLSFVICDFSWLSLVAYIIWPQLQKIIGFEGMLIGLQQSKSHIFRLELTRDNQGEPGVIEEG